MASGMIAPLLDRGVVSVSGPDAEKLLQGLITNDMGEVPASGALFAGLLSPQGKILFDFLIVEGPSGYLIDIARDRTAEFIKRLSMYRLRADVAISDVSDRYVVLAAWGNNPTLAAAAPAVLSVTDPRHPGLGLRIMAEASAKAAIVASEARGAAEAQDYHAHRISLGVAEGGKDYAFADAYPHDANFDLTRGVSFTKGCYVGQEVVARTENKAVVRKRVVRLTSAAELMPGADVAAGAAVIGKVGSVAGQQGLALVRLDRVTDALDAGIPVTSGGAPVSIDPEAVARYRTAAVRHAATAAGP
jgi:tRNA-modifying protein YgfZ